eukprot:6432052-Pyramimonas_sp.AAC.1
MGATEFEEDREESALRTNQTQDQADADQSDAGSAGMLSRRTNRTQEAQVCSHDGPMGKRTGGHVKRDNIGIPIGIQYNGIHSAPVDAARAHDHTRNRTSGIHSAPVDATRAHAHTCNRTVYTLNRTVYTGNRMVYTMVYLLMRRGRMIPVVGGVGGGGTNCPTWFASWRMALRRCGRPTGVPGAGGLNSVW